MSWMPPRGGGYQPGTSSQIPAPPQLIPEELRQYIGDINPNARLPRHRTAMMLALMAKALQDQLSKPQFGVTVRVETRPEGFTLHADIDHPQVIDDVQPG